MQKTGMRQGQSCNRMGRVFKGSVDVYTHSQHKGLPSSLQYTVVDINNIALSWRIRRIVLYALPKVRGGKEELESSVRREYELE